MPDYSPIRRLYHFTDVRNLPSIREHGGLLSLSLLEQMAIDIPAAGGDLASQATDRSKDAHKYVHCCLLAKHPMEYQACASGRIQKSIFLEIDPRVVQADGVKFAPGLVNTTGIRIYDLPEALDMGIVDTEPLYRWISWRLFPEVYQRRVKAEKFEILIPDFISLDDIRNFPSHG